MSESDTLDLKTGRNTVNRSRHLYCVDQINKEQSAMMKMFHSNEARFRKQYIRYEPMPPSASSEAKNVIMFETHTPGFCYRRNGDIRTAAVSHDADNEYFIQNINDLLFYNDEVDIERVMCLHLLSLQYVKRETRFRNLSRTSYAVGKNSLSSGSLTKSTSSSIGPYELRRSLLMPVLNCVIQAAKETLQKVNNRTKIDLDGKNSVLTGSSIKLLPSYLVITKTKAENHEDYYNEDPFGEVQTEGSSQPMGLTEPVTADEEMKTIEKSLRLYAHRPIRIMVDTVLDALQALSSNKVKKIKDLAKSPAALREMFMKPEIQEFVEILHEKPFLSRGDLYHLVPVKLLINPDKNSSPKLTPSGQEVPIVNAIEISESSQTALKSLINDVKLNIGIEERMKEYKHSSDKNFLLSYSLSNLSIQPNASPSGGKIPDQKDPPVTVLTSPKVNAETSEAPRENPVEIRRISKDANFDDISSLKGGFTISSFTGFSSKVNQADTSIVSYNDGISEAQEETLAAPKRKPIFNPVVSTDEDVTRKQRETRPKRGASKLVSELQMGLMADLARAKKSSPERSEKKPRAISRVDSYYKFSRCRSPLALAAEKEFLKQRVLDLMSPFQRMHVFKKLNMIKDKDSYPRVEDIPFASYVVPILSKKSITEIVSKLNEKDRKKIFLPEREGGLGLPQCYTSGLGTKRPRNDSAKRSQINDTVSPTDETIVDTKLTEVDVSRLKCEIAEKETHKKFLRLMSKPIPN